MIGFEKEEELESRSLFEVEIWIIGLVNNALKERCDGCMGRRQHGRG